MTWSGVIARGSGRTEYRLVIEGFASEWVTSSTLAGAGTHGRTRRVGLRRQGLGFGGRIIPIEAKLEGTGLDAEIVDIDGQASREFARRGQVVAILAGDLTGSGTTMKVENTSSLVVNNYYQLNTECIRVTAVTDTATATIERQRRDTLEQAHFRFDGSNDSIQAPIVDHPVTMRGRRVYLYAYGDGETGDGTLIFRGVINAPPARNGLTSWNVQVDPISTVLDQETSSKDIRPTRIRGYYYPWNRALTMRIGEWAKFPLGFEGAKGHEMKLVGFFEDVGALAKGINEFCKNTVNADVDIKGDFYCKPNGTGKPLLGYKCTDSDRFPRVQMLGLDNKWVEARVYKVDLSSSVGYTTVNRWDAVVNQGYVIEIGGSEELMSDPFCWLGGRLADWGEDLLGADSSQKANFPPNRLYLAAAVNVAAGGGIELANIDFGKDLMLSVQQGSISRVTADSARLIVTTYDTTDNYVELAQVDDGSGKGRGGRVTADAEIRATQVFGVDANLATFRTGLTTAAINANRGDTPFITTSDLADWSTVIDAAASVVQLAKRTYAYNKPQKILDIIEGDLKLMGCYMTYDADGKIAVAKFTEPTDSDPDAISITDADILVSEGFPEWAIENDGFYNSIELSTGYDSFLDQYTGQSFLFRDTTSMGWTKQTHTLEIKPLSDPTPPNAIVDDKTYSASLGSTLKFFGKPYYVVTLKVPMTKFNARLGSTVILTSKYIPNPESGIPGLLSHPCLLVGREWELDRGVGTLTLYMFEFPSHGYAPACRIDNANSIDISAGARTAFRFATVENFYAPAGKKDLSYMAIGDPVNVQKRLDPGWSGEFIDGIITAINLNASPPTVDVTFTSAMPGGFPGAAATPAHILKWYPLATGTSRTTNMRKYAATARNTDMKISNDESAIRFSP
jgi:hypothetical protein